MKKYFESLISESVAILCARFWWKGKVAEVSDDGVLLSSASMVYETGQLSGTKPKSEEVCATDIFVSFGAIELAGQFPWAFDGIEAGGGEK